MGIKIVLKEILSETEGVVEYGASRDFIIGAPGTAGRGSSDYEIVVWDYEQIPDATDIVSWNLPDGNYFYQAFKENGEDELGFRIKYRKFTANGSNYHQLIIYNEEAGLYVAGDNCGVTNNRRERLIIALNGYWGSTLEGALSAMKTQWEIKAPCYMVGLNTNKYALLTVLAGRDETSAYYNQFSGRLMMSLYGRMRYASSWYKLITGEFENVDNLFSAAVTEASAGGVEKKKTFYFGKALEKTEEIPITSYLRSSYSEATAADLPEGYADVEFGTDLSWYIKNYNDAPIVFENGMTISLEREDSKVYAVLRAPVEVDGNVVTYTLKEQYMSTLRLDDDYVVSTLRAFLVYNMRYLGEGVCLGAAPIVSPYYNEVPSEDLVSFINGIEEPANPTAWTQLPLRFITFAQTSDSWATAEQRNNFYGYNSDGDMTLTWSGAANVADYANGGNIRFIISNREIPEIPGTQFCDFDRQGWVAVAKYEKPKEPPKTGGGSLGGGGNRRGGGKGKFDDSSDPILPPTDIPGLESDLVQIWDLGNRSDGATNLEKIAEWIGNTTIFDSYTRKFSSIISLKSIFSPGDLAESHASVTMQLSSEYVPYTSAKRMYQYTTFDLGTFELEEYFGNFLDYENTKIELYLPFSGTYELSASEIVGCKCTLQCTIDAMYAAVKYNLIIENPGIQKHTTYHFEGQNACDIPLTSSDYTRSNNAILSGVVSATMIGAGIASGNTPMTLAGGSFLANSIAKVPDNHSKPGSGLTSVMDVREPYFLITRPKIAIPEDFGHFYGWKSNVSGKIGDFTGMSVVKEVHLEGIPCFESERKELEQILKTGVIL